MIIYTILNLKNNKQFTKVFDTEYEAAKFRRKIHYSKRLLLLHSIYDI